MQVIFIAFLCVIGLSTGQLLFKVGATSLYESGSFFAPKTVAVLFVAISIYAITTLAWIWTLQKIDLGKIYPLTALSVILVPIGSYFLLGELFRPQYFLGVMLIIIGVLVAVSS